MVACSIGRQLFQGRSLPPVAPGKAICGAVPKPTRRKKSHICSRGMARASLAAPTLEDFCSTCDTLITAAGWTSRIVKFARVRAPGAVDIGVADVTLPLSSARATVKGLRVEP